MPRRPPHAAAIHAHKFNQWLFYRQWTQLKAYANKSQIRIVGDIPIFVASTAPTPGPTPVSSSWTISTSPPSLQACRRTTSPPPDSSGATALSLENHAPRTATPGGCAASAALRLYDIVRADHFRGFAGYWEVPAGEETAENGWWVKGLGADFFEVVQKELGELPIIAEDLGEITPDVIELRNRFNLPGMKVLQFAFSTEASDKFLPHNFTSNFVVYSGTHDNDTSRGWYEKSSTPEERDFFRRYLRTDGSDPAWSLIDAAFRSVAVMAVVPLQDVLNLDTHSRMNLPGTSSGTGLASARPLTGTSVRLLEAVTLRHDRRSLTKTAAATVGRTGRTA